MARLTTKMMSRLLEMGQEDIRQGLVINLPLDVIYMMTFTVAINLAKMHIETGVRLSQEMLGAIAGRVCGSVLN
jgi:hypothetical protein